MSNNSARRSSSDSNFNFEVSILGDKNILKNEVFPLIADGPLNGSECLEIIDLSRKLRDDKVCVISSFSSYIEKEAFHFLLKGDQPIVIVINDLNDFQIIDTMIERIKNRNGLIVLLEREGQLVNFSEMSMFIKEFSSKRYKSDIILNSKEISI